MILDVRTPLVALSLALDVFAVALGFGVRQLTHGARLRLGIAFVVAELTMACIGGGIGLLLARIIGSFAAYFGCIALIGIGIFVIVQGQQHEEHRIDLSRGWGLLLTALSVSLDSLGVGIALPFLGVSFPRLLGILAVTTVVATILGFSLGRSLGNALASRAELLAGLLLAVTGLLGIVLKVTGHG